MANQNWTMESNTATSHHRRVLLADNKGNTVVVTTTFLPEKDHVDISFVQTGIEVFNVSGDGAHELVTLLHQVGV